MKWEKLAGGLGSARLGSLEELDDEILALGLDDAESGEERLGDGEDVEDGPSSGVQWSWSWALPGSLRPRRLGAGERWERVECRVRFASTSAAAGGGQRVAFFAAREEELVEMDALEEEAQSVSEVLRASGVWLRGAPRLGTPVLAPYGLDGRSECREYYRAVLVRHGSAEKGEVVFVDWGNRAVMPFQEMLPMPAPLAELPLILFQCQVILASKREADNFISHNGTRILRFSKQLDESVWLPEIIHPPCRSIQNN